MKFNKNFKLHQSNETHNFHTCSNGLPTLMRFFPNLKTEARNSKRRHTREINFATNETRFRFDFDTSVRGKQKRRCVRFSNYYNNNVRVIERNDQAPRLRIQISKISGPKNRWESVGC